MDNTSNPLDLFSYFKCVLNDGLFSLCYSKWYITIYVPQCIKEI